LESEAEKVMVQGQVGRICFFRIFSDEDLFESIRKSVEECGVKAGAFFLIGTLKNAVLGYYKEGRYEHIRIDSPLEIASCMGNVSVDEKNEVMIHPHIVVADEKGKCFGGHLMPGSQVAATAELVIIEASDLSLQREFDETTKLKLWKLS
jgi:predicted DNA-binding protein with PD1-like motif